MGLRWGSWLLDSAAYYSAAWGVLLLATRLAELPERPLIVFVVAAFFVHSGLLLSKRSLSVAYGWVLVASVGASFLWTGVPLGGVMFWLILAAFAWAVHNQRSLLLQRS